MRAVVDWTANELLSRKGFFDGTFATSYGRRHGRIIAPEEFSSADVQSLARASFVIGDDYPDYVLCLVYLLSCRGLKYIVLHDPEIGSHNVDCLDSFVYKGGHMLLTQQAEEHGSKHFLQSCRTSLRTPRSRWKLTPIDEAVENQGAT